MIAAAFGAAGMMACALGAIAIGLGVVLLTMGGHWIGVAYAILTQN